MFQVTLIYLWEEVWLKGYGDGVTSRLPWFTTEMYVVISNIIKNIWLNVSIPLPYMNTLLHLATNKAQHGF